MEEDFKVPTLPSQSPPAKGKVETAVENTSSTATPAPSTPTGSEQQEQQEPHKATTNDASPYKVPTWSAPPPPDVHYKFEVLKSGLIIDEINDLQRQDNWKFGRLPANDIEMAHPTISRFHAVFQYRPSAPKNDDEDAGDNSETAAQPDEGWYVYDLGSTHGTFLNKQRVPPRVFIRMRVGHILRLGSSTRSYILQGPADDEEPESELSVTELRAERQRQAAEIAAEEQRKVAEEAERERNKGIAWGMAEDADEETDLAHNPYAATNNEELFLDDPKRTLRGYFEREGLNLEYKCDEMSAGSFVCRVELPLDDSNGRPIIAEVVHKGRKKECVVQCALEACRILDRHGVLRQANQEPLKRKSKLTGSDSDEDEFWDRTGDVERKKQRRANSNTSVTLTYKDLLKRGEELDLQLLRVDAQIENYQATRERLKEAKAQGKPKNIDDLDSYMMNLCDDLTHLDKTEIRKLRLEQQQLKAEKQKILRLAKIAKPVELKFTTSAFTKATSSSEAKQTEKEATKTRQLPIIGKRNQFSKFKVVKTTQPESTKQTTTSKALASDEEEIEDEDDLEIQPGTSSQHKSPPADAMENEKHVENDTKSEVEVEPLPISQAILEQNVDEEPEESNQSSAATTSKVAAAEEFLAVAESTDNASKKRRQRQRLRLKRQEVDIDELAEHESSEKYAKWVPPDNQSGDGYTKLNEKYGY